MKRIALALSLFALPCFADNPQSSKGDREFQLHFSEWEKEVAAQLESNRSWIIPVHARVKYLVEKAPKNLAFLAKELETNMFVYQILDASHDLKTEYGIFDQTGSVSVQERQRIWLAALKKDQTSEQDGADQPATAPESKPEGKDKPKPESEMRPQ